MLDLLIIILEMNYCWRIDFVWDDLKGDVFWNEEWKEKIGVGSEN